MKVLCLVKPVLNPAHIKLDPETRKLVREGVPLGLNEFDVYAVSEAIRLRDERGGEVVTMTMGPPQAHDVGLVGDWRETLPPLAEALEEGVGGVAHP